MKAAPTAISGGLPTRAQLCKELGTKPSEKEKGSEDAEEIARRQEMVYRDGSGRKIYMKVGKAEATRHKRGRMRRRWNGEGISSRSGRKRNGKEWRRDTRDSRDMRSMQR